MLDPINLQTFGQCLKQILAEKKISASALARMMELKSRNSLFRILDDTSGPAAQMTFYDQLLGKDCLQLTDEQKNMLETALEISRLGVDCYRSNLALHRLFREAENKNEPILVKLRDGKEVLLEQQIAEYASSPSIHINITGCCDKGIFEVLAEQLLTGNTHADVSIRHYLYTGGDDIICAMAAVQPVLYSPKYMGYCVEPGSCSMEREQIFRGNNLSVQFVDRDGNEHFHILALYEHRRFLCIEQCSPDSVDVFRELVKDGSEWMQPIKSPFALYRSSEDYQRFMEKCGKLEYGRAIYIVKRDIPVAFIHPDTAIPAIEASFQQAGYSLSEKGWKKLREVQRRRFENFYGKTRPTHIIFSQEDMMRFAQTGEQRSCFLALRPYTPQERVSILTHIRVHAEDNPYFHVYFFKPSFQPLDPEIGMYEGKGVRFSRMDDCNHPRNEYAETLITHKAFCEKYKAFFLNDLIVNQVISREETLAFLDRLIETARQCGLPKE